MKLNCQGTVTYVNTSLTHDNTSLTYDNASMYITLHTTCVAQYI